MFFRLCVVLFCLSDYIYEAPNRKAKPLEISEFILILQEFSGNSAMARNFLGFVQVFLLRITFVANESDKSISGIVDIVNH